MQSYTVKREGLI